MRSSHPALWLAVLAGSILTAAAAFGDAPVRLKRLPPLAPGIPALPRLVARPADRAARAINSALAGADADTEGAAEECRQAGPDRSDFSRSVTVTMRGPRYLNIVDTRSWYCGGAYPDQTTALLTYDLTTGASLDWLHLLPAALLGRTIDYNLPGEALIASAVLTKRYIELAADKAECRDVLANWDGGLGFMLWPDAAADGIAIQPDNLPHVVKACGPPVTIAASELRKLGVDAALLDAIDEAHRRGWYGKPPAKR